MLRGAAAGRSPDYLGAVTDTETVARLIRLAHRVYIADALYAYAVRLATATRDHKQVRVGVSPRGVIALTRAAQAYALIGGRGYVVPEDVKALIEPVFAHRLLLAPDAAMRGVTAVGGAADRGRGGRRAGPDRRAGLTATDRRCGSPTRGYGLLAAGVLLLGAGFWFGYPELAALGAAAVVAVLGALGFVAWRPRLTVAPGGRPGPGHARRAQPGHPEVANASRFFGASLVARDRLQARRRRVAARCPYRWSGCGRAG